MSMVEIEDLKDIIGNITDIVIVPTAGSVGTPIIFLNDAVRAMTRNKKWWHPHKELFKGDCVVLITVSDPKMHAMNISGNYRFRYNRIKSEWSLVSPIELHLMYTRQMKCLMGLVGILFNVDMRGD